MTVVSLREATDAEQYGGKAVQLGAALRAGLPVPAGYAVSVGALGELCQGSATLALRIRQIAEELGAPVAARSSAVGEDGAEASFAGQHLTVLNLMRGEAVIDALARVHDSAHGEGALAYRQKKGIPGEVRMAAVVQKLIGADAAGVLFTRNPLSGAREFVIEAAWGLGEAVVAGLVTPDHYRVALDGRILEARSGEKDLMIQRAAGGGTEEVEVPPEKIHSRCLSDAELTQLAALARECERHLGENLDLEWALSGPDLFLLQSRPISTKLPLREFS